MTMFCPGVYSIVWVYPAGIDDLKWGSLGGWMHELDVASPCGNLTNPA